MTDPQIIIGLSAATGAVIGSLLTMALRGPRTIFVPTPVYRDPPIRVPAPAVRESEAAYERRMSMWREQQREARRNRPRPVDPRSLLPKDIESRPKLGSMAEAYEAERKQLQQARREWPEVERGDALLVNGGKATVVKAPRAGTVTGASGVPVQIKAGDELSVTAKGEPVVRRPRRSRKKET